GALTSGRRVPGPAGAVLRLAGSRRGRGAHARVHRPDHPPPGGDRVPRGRVGYRARRPGGVRAHPLRLHARGTAAALGLRGHLPLPRRAHRAAGALLRSERSAGGTGRASVAVGRRPGRPPRLATVLITIYGSHMSTAKTTVYLDAADYERLKAIARRERRPPAALVREAVKEYAQRRDRRPVPRSLGAGRSGGAKLSERAEELLEGMGRSR